MKRLIAILLLFAFLTGCVAPQNNETSQEVIETSAATVPEFTSLNDPELLRYMEDSIYSDLITQFDGEEYFIEDVRAVYISKEYLEELSYNSQSNIFFDYTLTELDEAFQGKKYVFALNESGKTTVKEFEEYTNPYETVLENVIVGSGIILICVVVSVASGGMGAPAVSSIFAVSAKTGTVCALSSTAFSAVSAGIVTGIETGDFNKALEAAALNGSEGFKWGAIGGAISGGIGETARIYDMSKNGLTMNEAVRIQRESKLPTEYIKKFHSVEEYEVYKKLSLKQQLVNNKHALTQKINWKLKDSQGRTNAQRVEAGLSPIDKSGKSYELHHIGQSADSPLAILTKDQHNDYYSVLHKNTGSAPSAVDHGLSWNKERKEFWNALLKHDTMGG